MGARALPGLKSLGALAVAVVTALAVLLWPSDEAKTPTRPAATSAPVPAGLPAGARPVIAAIRRGGPFEYRQDGGVFQNREGLLPRRPRGYYREYTVETPGSDDRGPRRIVTGGDPPAEFFYTDDHYQSFRRLTP